MSPKHTFKNITAQGISTYKNINLDKNLTHLTKNKLKITVDLNVKYRSIELLEDNKGVNLDDLGYNDDVLDTTSKSWSMEE